MLIGMLAIIGSGLAAAGMFGYEFYLKTSRDSKQGALTQAQEAIDLNTVEEFILLKNRLSTAGSLLDSHVYLSSFFDVLEERTLQTVTFSSLRLTVDDARSAEIQMTGRATTFNALAAQSALLATDRHIRRAIFSGITADESGAVQFSLTATVDPRLITGKDLEGGSLFVDPATLSPTPAPEEQPQAQEEPLGTAESEAPVQSEQPVTEAPTQPSPETI